MTRLIDCHSHCALSGHGEGTVADMIGQAAKLGLHTYCMTEHLGVPESMDPLHEDSVPPAQVDRYCLDVMEQRIALTAQGSDMSVVLGAELDWLGTPENKEDLVKFASRFEYTLGSIHFLKGKAVDNSDAMALWEELGTDGVWELYVNEWLRMASSGVRFCAFAHPDLPKVFGERPSFDVRDAYAEMVDAVVRADAAVEVNTAGWRKKAAEQYPAEGMLKMLIQKKVPITVGADAHKPAGVAVGVEDAYELLRRLGATRVVAPTQNTARTGEWCVLEL